MSFYTAGPYTSYYSQDRPPCCNSRQAHHRQNQLWVLGFQQRTTLPVVYISFFLRIPPPRLVHGVLFLLSLVLARCLLFFPFFLCALGQVFISHLGHLLLDFLYCVFLVGFGQVSFLLLFLFTSCLFERDAGMRGWGGMNTRKQGWVNKHLSMPALRVDCGGYHVNLFGTYITSFAP